jgi:pimeloyl-ACP methyl ester carboxylesterase
MATSELLGPSHTVDLPSGRLAYHERGTGSPVVFVHGLLSNANLWRNVVPPLVDAGFRTLAPDWPLGSHRIPMPPGADISPPGVARLIAEFLDVLDLTDVTIVANDTGGALTQLLMTDHPDRLGRIVLTPCDAFDCFFPPMVKPLQYAVAVPGMTWLLGKAVQRPGISRSNLAYGLLSKRPLPPEILASFTRPLEDPRVRRDMRRFVRSVHKRYTLAAADRLPNFKQPVLVVAAPEDKIFPARLADRLTELLPDARKVTVADSYTFVSEDKPAELARLVVEFLRSE